VENIPIVVRAVETNLAIRSLPNRVLFFEGEHFDPTGMLIYREYSNGNSVRLNASDYTLSHGVLYAGAEVKVTHGNLSIIIPVSVVPAATATVLTVSTPFARRGDEVTVDISISNNPGFATMPLRISIPEGLTLVKFELGHPALHADFVGPPGVSPGEPTNITNQFFVNWTRTTNFTQSGTLLRLTFATNPNAEPGNYPVNIAFETVFAPSPPRNAAAEPLNIFIVDGAVRLNTFVIGDVNGDGVVDLVDASWLAMRLADHPVTINMEASLVTAASIERGFPDLLDVVRIRRVLAGHPVNFGD
jgi:hypothetical protein